MSMAIIQNLDDVFNSIGFVNRCHKRQLPRRKRLYQQLPISILDVRPCKVFDEIKTLSYVADSDDHWHMSLDLRKIPTKPEDIEVKLDGDKLNISGKSEITNENNGFKTFSVHEWSKEIKLANKVKKDTIKASIDKNNQLQIKADIEGDEEQQIPIKIN